jgi:hypothetical protein
MLMRRRVFTINAILWRNSETHKNYLFLKDVVVVQETIFPATLTYLDFFGLIRTFWDFLGVIRSYSDFFRLIRTFSYLLLSIFNPM